MELAFCAGCGVKHATDARFCEACGRPTGASLTVATAAPTAPGAEHGRSPRSTAVVVFAWATLVGVLVASAAIHMSGSGDRAVPGTPSAGGKPSQQAPDMPANHPPVELPAEVVKFLDDLTKTAEAAPKDIEVWRKLARARYRAGMLDKSHFAGAREALAHLRELAPQDTEAIRLTANIAYDGAQFADAEKLFRQYLELDPKDPSVRTDLGSAVLFQGRTEEARRMYADVIASNPDFVQAHVNLGVALHGEGKTDEAMASFRHAREMAKDPDQQQRIDQIIAMAEGRAPQAQPDRQTAERGGASAASGGAPPTTNASTPFQKGVDRLLADHSIVGPRVAGIDWTGATNAKVRLPGFPMDQMPAVVRNKFKSTMNEKIAALVTSEHVSTDVRIELLDDNGRVMDTLDAKELIGAFAEQPQG